MMVDELASSLDISGQDDLRCVTCFNRTDLIKSRDAVLSVSLPGCPELFKVTACTTSELHINYRALNWDRAVAEWPYLAALPPPPPSDAKIQIIIGMDVVRAHLHREVIEPPPGVDGPIAIRTDVGWCYVGPVDQSFIHPSSSWNVMRFGATSPPSISSSDASSESSSTIHWPKKSPKKKQGTKHPLKIPRNAKSRPAVQPANSGLNHPTKTHLIPWSCDDSSTEIFAFNRPPVPPDKIRNRGGPFRTVSLPTGLS